MKFKIFISSRNNDTIVVGESNDQNLSDIRLWLKEELEKEKLLEKELFDIRINETFNQDASLDSYHACLDEVDQADFVIILYNGEAGWAPDGVEMGICHAEFARAIEKSAKKTAIIDIQKFSPSISTDPKSVLLNDLFKNDINSFNRFNNPLKLSGKHNIENFKNTLLKEIKNTIHKHLLNRIKLANTYYDLSGNTKTILDWKKLKYSDRNNVIKEALIKLITQSPSFDDINIIANAIPDNMSVEDAKSFTGRPFLEDHIKISESEKTGPLHFIAVYGNATEIQVKNLIGYPDVSVIKDEFGIYVWEQNNHIQMVFLTDCKTQSAISSKFILFNNWASSSGEIDKIKTRAKARLHILQAINDAKEIVKENDKKT